MTHRFFIFHILVCLFKVEYMMEPESQKFLCNPEHCWWIPLSKQEVGIDLDFIQQSW